LDFDEVWPFSRTTKPRYSRALEFGEQGRGKRAAKVTDGGARGRILAARQPGVELGHKLLDRTSHPERAKAVELVVESASGLLSAMFVDIIRASIHDRDSKYSYKGRA